MVEVYVGILPRDVHWGCPLVPVRMSALPTLVVVLALLLVLDMTALFLSGPNVLCQQPVRGVELLVTLR